MNVRTTKLSCRPRQENPTLQASKSSQRKSERPGVRSLRQLIDARLRRIYWERILLVMKSSKTSKLSKASLSTPDPHSSVTLKSRFLSRLSKNGNDPQSKGWSIRYSGAVLKRRGLVPLPLLRSWSRSSLYPTHLKSTSGTLRSKMTT